MSEDNGGMFTEFWVKMWSNNFKQTAYVIHIEEAKNRHSQICQNPRQNHPCGLVERIIWWRNPANQGMIKVKYSEMKMPNYEKSGGIENM